MTSHPSCASADRRVRIATPPHTHARTNKRLFSKPRISRTTCHPPAFRDCTSTTPQPALHPPLHLPTSTCPPGAHHMHVAATAQVHAGPYRDIPVALATALSSQGNVAPTAHSRTLRLPCRLHKARGYALVRPQAPGHFLYGPGRGGRGGMARAPDRGGLRVAGPGLVSRPQRQARHGALPSKPPSVTTPQPAPHSGTLEAPQRTARRPPSTAAIPFGHERPSGLGSRRTTGALDT